MRNAPDNDDDLDYIIVAKDGRVWLARLFAVILVKIVQRRGIVLCPNYVLGEGALRQERHDLFIAHELAQMVPIMGENVYDQMRQTNAWTSALLPNADTAPLFTQLQEPRGIVSKFKKTVEFVLGGALGDRFEKWEMRRKIRKFAAQLETSIEGTLDESQVKGHFMDYGQWTMQNYQTQVDALGLQVPQHYGADAAD